MFSFGFEQYTKAGNVLYSNTYLTNNAGGGILNK